MTIPSPSPLETLEPRVLFSVDVVWSAQLGSGIEDYGRGMAVDDAGNAFLLSNRHQGGQSFLTKITAAGEVAWTRQVGEKARAQAVTVGPDGDLWITGYGQEAAWITGVFGGTHGGGRDAFVARLSSAGDVEWATFLGGVGDDEAYGIEVNAAGDVYVVGNTESEAWVSGGFDTQRDQATEGFLVKLAPAGAVEWSTYLDTGSLWPEQGTGTGVGGGVVEFAVGNDGTAYLPVTRGDSNDRDAGVTAVNADGTLGWSRYFADPVRYESASSLARNDDGDLWLLVEDQSNTLGVRPTILHLDETGDLVWTHPLATAGRLSLADVAVDAADRVWITGRETGGGAGQEAFVLHLDNDGTELRFERLGPTFGQQVEVDAEGRVWLAGTTFPDADTAWATRDLRDPDARTVDQFVMLLDDTAPATANLVGNVLHIVGGATRNVMRLDLWGGSYRLTLDGVVTNFAAGDVAQILIDGGGGDDALSVYLPASADTARITGGGSGRIVTQATDIRLSSVEATLVVGDAADTLYLVGSAAAETFRATPGTNWLLGAVGRVTARGFGDVYAAGGAEDAAELVGSAGDEVFRSTAAWSTLRHANWLRHTRGFGGVSATGGGGRDTAYLHGTAGDETFLHQPAAAALYAGQQVREARGFSRVYAYGGGGRDVARLHDTWGDDVLRGFADAVTLASGPRWSWLNGFTRIDALSYRGGLDRAFPGDAAGTIRLQGPWRAT